MIKINIFMRIYINMQKSVGDFLRFYVALKFRNANLTVRGENGIYNIDAVIILKVEKKTSIL